MEPGNQTASQMMSNTVTTTTTTTTPGSFESSEIDHCDPTDFEVSDFIMFDSNSDDLSTMVSGYLQSHGYAMNEARDMGSGGISSCLNQGESSTRGGANRSMEREAKVHIAFKTKSEIDALDDGFKWRKYGKKMVKNNPNPRNYYRCSVNGCPVKKRIERDGDDPRYVITTYQGIHDHQTSK